MTRGTRTCCEGAGGVALRTARRAAGRARCPRRPWRDRCWRSIPTASRSTPPRWDPLVCGWPSATERHGPQRRAQRPCGGTDQHPDAAGALSSLKPGHLGGRCAVRLAARLPKPPGEVATRPLRPSLRPSPADASFPRSAAPARATMRSACSSGSSASAISSPISVRACAAVLDVQLLVQREVLGRRAFLDVVIVASQPLELGLCDPGLAGLDRVRARRAASSRSSPAFHSSAHSRVPLELRRLDRGRGRRPRSCPTVRTWAASSSA